MPNEPDKNLERLIHEKLRDLPPVPAPDTLVARVRARVDARAHLPWWQQPWMTWPVAPRVMSALVVLGGIGGAGYLLEVHVPGVGQSLDGVAQSLGNWSWVWELAATLGNALLLLMDSFGTNYILIGAGLLLASYLSCIGLGTLCYRLTYQKR